MKAFLFSDLHANYKQLANFEQLLAGNKQFDLAIFAGDVVNMGEPVGYTEQFIKVLQKINLPFFWVPGNNDFGRSYHKLNAKYPSLEGKVTKLNSIIPNASPELRLTGVGGSPESWAGQYMGEQTIREEDIADSIFVSHVPPPGVHNYRYFNEETPVKTKKLSNAPKVHICGHIHYREGFAYLGPTKIIKLASAERGHYAIMDIENFGVEFKRF